MNVQARSQLISHQDIEGLLELRDIKEELNIINDIIEGHQVVVEELIVQTGKFNAHCCKRPKGHGVSSWPTQDFLSLYLICKVAT
jgi:hypothetical protein